MLSVEQLKSTIRSYLPCRGEGITLETAAAGTYYISVFKYFRVNHKIYNNHAHRFVQINLKMTSCITEYVEIIYKHRTFL